MSPPLGEPDERPDDDEALDRLRKQARLLGQASGWASIFGTLCVILAFSQEDLEYLYVAVAAVVLAMALSFGGVGLQARRQAALRGRPPGEIDGDRETRWSFASVTLWVAILALAVAGLLVLIGSAMPPLGLVSG